MASAVFDAQEAYRAEDLVGLIRRTLVPETERSGQIRLIREFDGKLVARLTRQEHRTLRRLLSALRGRAPTRIAPAAPAPGPATAPARSTTEAQSGKGAAP